MLFRLKHGVDSFELNPGARAIPEFDCLTDKQFFFVCLVADVDRDNPLYTLPEVTKRTKAASLAGYGMEGNRPDKNARNLIGGKVASVEAAIKVYRENQFDEDKANLAAIDRQILEIRAFLEKDKELMATDEKTKKIDLKSYQQLLQAAGKLGPDLRKLTEEKRELEKVIKAKSPVNIGIQTNTAADITDDEQQQLDNPDEQVSTLDIVMAKERTNATDRHDD